MDGLDGVLNGGFLPGRAYLISGGPGAGKTTLGLHFLSGAPAGEALLVSFGQPVGDIRDDAARIGLDIDGAAVIDLSPAAEGDDGGAYTLLEPWEAEPPDIRARIEQACPDGLPRRVVIDALSQFRQLTPDSFQFRKQVMALLAYLTHAGATVLFTAERGSEADRDLQYLGDGILQLDHGEFGRTLTVTKFRGSGFAEGRHTVRLTSQGMSVYERLVPGDHGQDFAVESISSGLPELDALVGGGLTRGTITIISGPTGVGKTSLGAQFMREAARRGERSVIFGFEEKLQTFRHRCEQIGIPVSDMLDAGTFAYESVEPLHYSPDEFAIRVRQEVEVRGAGMVMLDSLSGYGKSVTGGDLDRRTHALCRYLSNMGVTVLLVNEVGAIAGGELRVSDQGISYLADAVVLLRYIELDGELRKTIGMLKKRTGDFERVLREFRITTNGIAVGPPLHGMRGILHGLPEFTAAANRRGRNDGDG